MRENACNLASGCDHTGETPLPNTEQSIMSTTRRDFLTASAGLAAGLSVPLAPSAQAATSKAPEMPPFQLGLVTYNVAKNWDLPTVLRVCQRVGLKAVECRTTHKHGVEPELGADARKKVKAQFAEAGVVFWGAGSTCEFHQTDAAVVNKNIETCKRFVDLVADLGGMGVKVRPNAFPKGVSQEKTLEQIGKALIPCGKAAADAGIEICVEVHGSGTSHPPHMKTIMEVCNHPAVGVTWNCNRSDLLDGGIDKSFAMLKPWIKSCHLKDMFDEHRGRYPYRRLFRLLREAGYDRYTLCEVGWTPSNVRDGEEMLKYYRSLWLELTKG